jgi:hypothetical protein
VTCCGLLIRVQMLRARGTGVKGSARGRVEAFRSRGGRAGRKKAPCLVAQGANLIIISRHLRTMGDPRRDAARAAERGQGSEEKPPVNAPGQGANLG